MTVYRKNITINVGETFSEDLTLLSSDGTGPSAVSYTHLTLPTTPYV